MQVWSHIILEDPVLFIMLNHVLGDSYVVTVSHGLSALPFLGPLQGCGPLQLYGTALQTSGLCNTMQILFQFDSILTSH